LLESHSQSTYSDQNVAGTSTKAAGPEVKPFYDSFWFAKEDNDNRFLQIKTWLNHLYLGSGTYQVAATPCKHICTLSKLGKAKTDLLYQIPIN
jgi:hypothetical protein